MSELNVFEAELATARKIFWLLTHDYVFLSNYNNTSEDWDDGSYPVINCNDLFVPGGDSEGLSAEYLDMYIEACKLYGDFAGAAWCAAKRNAQLWRQPENEKWLSGYTEALAGILVMLKTHNTEGKA